MERYIATDFVWVEVSGRKIIDMADGDYYAGCRCDCTHHPLEKCNNFKPCLFSILRKIYNEKYDVYLELKREIESNYKDVFHKLEIEQKCINAKENMCALGVTMEEATRNMKIVLQQLNENTSKTEHE